MRPLAYAITFALSTSVVPAQAASAPPAPVYGYAWPDGQGHLRIMPRSATPLHGRGHVQYTIKSLNGAKELRLDYTGASYGRVTVACDLKETEGRVAVDREGLGRTRCEPADLADALARGPVPVRVEHQDGKATRINELLVAERPDPRTARGTISRINDTTVLFATGATRIRLGYTYATGFQRTTARCGDTWLAGRPVNADRNGLGKKNCTSAELTKALKTVKHPVLVKIDYTPGADSLNHVWEIYGDA
ncbi:hypothetical protein [Nonomuraea jiangxiensis]|uniref:META domain-containing protein n=1 Tax=Nonomuraea jiangxiensis TaxID=633440 RepID=A0A1G8NSD8_9ACTN|nr:hypothetical protein [Nonomuraea jiangxiensis]SDI83088.1 hypothetical protein SAMN05421869_107213 [Nonomuraea jiangxiensis]